VEAAEAVANEAHHLGDALAHERARCLLARFVAMRAAIERLAATPAPDSRKLTAKANAIGGIWLGQRAPGTMAFAHRSSAMPCGWASRTRRRASPSASEVDNR
jgi:hypothetical protein